MLAPEISEESCVIVALMHDLGKAGVPGKPQYIKNSNENKPWTPYIFNTNLIYMSVAAKEEPLTLLLQYADNWSGFVQEERA